LKSDSGQLRRLWSYWEQGKRASPGDRREHNVLREGDFRDHRSFPVIPANDGIQEFGLNPLDSGPGLPAGVTFFRRNDAQGECQLLCPGWFI
jgi:hypothetical protein